MSVSDATTGEASETAGSLVVSEVFGPTFQGEGPHTGRRVGFIRLGGCNLHCSWCDTPYTWDASRFDLREELYRRGVESIIESVIDMAVDRVIVSGGEPLLHQGQPAWSWLLGDLTENDITVEVETNGTIAPNDLTIDAVSLFGVSPKLAHAGDSGSARLKPNVLRTYAKLAEDDQAFLKLVCRTSDDVRAAALLAKSYRFPNGSVWVMPEGTTADDLLTRHDVIADAALASDLNFTTRLHTLTWGQERAR